MTASRNLRVGAYYLLGALALLLLASAAWPWGGLLLWPALSFVVVACGYAGAGGAIYGKKNGRLPLRTRVLMAPVILGQHLSLRYYERQCRPWDRVAPGLLMGKRLNEAEAKTLRAEGVTAVLDLTAEFTEAESLRSLLYLNLPILDLTAPTPEQLTAGVDFIRNHAPQGLVYVHCKIGYSRTAAFVGAYLMASGETKDADEAMARMRSARPSIVIRPEIVRALRALPRAYG